MPIPLLRAHLAMLPRLEAEESLVAAERLAVGTASLKADARRRVIDDWAKVARPVAVQRPTDPAARRALAAAAGIGMRVVRRSDAG